jgi:hypothetical protein
MFKRIGMLLMLVALTVGSALPAYASYGHRGYGYRGYGYRGYKHGGYGYRGYGHYHSRGPSFSIVVPFGLPYFYPPVVVAPPPVYVQPQPQVYVQPPPPQPYWYYCDNPQGYYPYVAQCPGGWRAVPPTPAR